MYNLIRDRIYISENSNKVKYSNKEKVKMLLPKK